MSNVRIKIKETWKWQDNLSAEIVAKHGYTCAQDFGKVVNGFWELKVIKYKNDDDMIKSKDGEVVALFRTKQGDIPLSMEEIAEIEGDAGDTIIIKAECSKCKKEHLIFDSRIHGNDEWD